MSDIQKCLSVFAVSAWANTEASFSYAERAIAEYVSNFSKWEEWAALRDLQIAYGNMATDSAVAIAIRAELDNRIAALTDPDSLRTGGSTDGRASRLNSIAE